MSSGGTCIETSSGGVTSQFPVYYPLVVFHSIYLFHLIPVSDQSPGAVGLPVAGAVPVPTAADRNLSNHTPRLQSNLDAISEESFVAPILLIF